MSEVMEKTAETENVRPPRPPRGQWLRRHKKGLIAGGLAIAAAVWIGSRFMGSGGEGQTGSGGYIQAQAERRSIVSSLSGSGTLHPANSYTVTTLIEGEVLAADFEESDVVEKGAVLYQIDSSDAASNIERSEISLQQAQRSYADTVERQYVKADTGGTVFTLTVKEGDQVSAGQTIGTVRDAATMLLEVPFPAGDAKRFAVGQSAEVTLDGSFETLSGAVQAVSGADAVGAGNMITRKVTIAVNNPGGLSETQAATAVVDGVGSAGSGVFSCRTQSSLTAEAAGIVAAVNVAEGGSVSRGQTVVTLGGEDIQEMIQQAEESLRTTEISMESTREQLDNYTITAPISGTIVDKQYRAGETAEAGKTLCIIYDLSYLEMTLDIDELDISKVEVGQKVAVTAEAVEGRSYEGTVTKVSVAGTTTGSVTAYPVTVRIDKTDGLLPGMNVDAEIVLEEADNVLTIPSDAVARGNLVMITADSPSAVNAVERQAEEGYVYVQVETGVSDKDYVEIVSGLQEGDAVAYLATSSGDSFMMMGGMAMAGAPNGGGQPGGGGPVG